MDAYIFAASATSQAITDLAADVGTTVRVVLPTTVDYGLYVAVEGANWYQLCSRICAVEDTTGVSDPIAYVAALPEAPPGWLDPWPPINFPTRSAVDDYIGLALLVPDIGYSISVYTGAAALTDVIGAVIVNGDGDAKVIVEVSASTANDRDSALSAVTSLSNVTSSQIVKGAYANGYGFTHV